MIDLKIKNKKDCMGCYGCSNICPQSCITMKSDEEGFCYPKVDYNECIKCGLCIKICPIINKIMVGNNPRAYASINKNKDIRLESSSGGIFTLIAEEVIDEGGVVFGASFNHDFSVVHKYIETKGELRELRGAKYVQSVIGNTYRQVKEFLKQGRWVLFSGTPCQIAGLKSYLQSEYDKLFCVDIICHGVPSPKVWEKYIQFHEANTNSKLKKVSFRNKDEGWKQYSVSFLFKNNSKYIQKSRDDLYMQAFLKDVCLRPSCYACEFKTLNRQSDITLADFWGIQNMLPEMDDDKGTSLIFVNSIKGESMLGRTKDKALYKEVDIKQSVKYNSAAIKSVEYNQGREGFFNNLDNLSFDKLIKKYCSDKAVIRIKKKLRFFVALILRKTGTLEMAKKVLKR